MASFISFSLVYKDVRKLFAVFQLLLEAPLLVAIPGVAPPEPEYDSLRRSANGALLARVGVSGNALTAGSGHSLFGDGVWILASVVVAVPIVLANVLGCGH